MVAVAARPIVGLWQGETPGSWPALWEPSGPVLWAGTETAERWGGSIEGAIVAGERAAAQALVGSST